MKVFLGHSISEADGPIAERSRAIAVLYGRSVLLPVRLNYPEQGLAPMTEQAIKDSSVAVALVTKGGEHHNVLQRELATAGALGLPILVLREAGAVFAVPPGAQVVDFHRTSVAKVEPQLHAFFAKHAPKPRVKAGQSETDTMVGIVLVVLLFLFLAAVTGKPRNA